jgi:hypothetical protein
MDNKIFFSLIAFIVIGFTVFSCSDDGPTAPLDNDKILYGKVVDQQGNPVSGVNIHFIPSLIDTGLQKRGLLEPTPSTVIKFSIPEQTYVTLVLLRHSSRDTIAYLINNELLNAGNYALDANTESLTNGVYDYVLKYGTSIFEKSFLVLKTPEELVSAIPLVVTDSDGKFQLNYNEFGIGSVFGFSSEVSPEILFYKEISDTIQIHLIKNGFNNYLETVVIDTNKALNKNFTVTKP